METLSVSYMQGNFAYTVIRLGLNKLVQQVVFERLPCVISFTEHLGMTKNIQRADAAAMMFSL